jgi:hypothetical protein
MNNKLVLAVLMIALPATGAQAMDVATFLAKADALQGKGMLALFSSDIGLLKREIGADVKALVDEARAAASAGRPHAFCPQPGKMSLNSEEIIASMRTVPAAERPRTDVRQPLKVLLARKYPCR